MTSRVPYAQRTDTRTCFRGFLPVADNTIHVAVAACEQYSAGLQTRVFIGQCFVRIRQLAGQHSVQIGQHSCAKGLQIGARASADCERSNSENIKP